MEASLIGQVGDHIPDKHRRCRRCNLARRSFNSCKSEIISLKERREIKERMIASRVGSGSTSVKLTNMETDEHSGFPETIDVEHFA